LKAADHIHHAPGLSWTYARAEQGRFDPYVIGAQFGGVFARICWSVDRGIDWLYNVLSVKAAKALTNGLALVQSKNYPGYLAWSLAGMSLVVFFVFFAR
jgi:hypothetical protein